MNNNTNDPTAPTAYYHPDYSVSWDIGTCINTLPLDPWNSPTYSTQLDCCENEYNYQMSNACIEGMVNPPTQSPTKTGGPDIYYPDYSLSWEDGRCINKVPRPSGVPTFTTMLACCQEAYAGQVTRACKNAVPTNPIVQIGTLYYPDYSLAWDEGICVKTLPIPSGRPTHTTLSACCATAYAGQYSQACINSESVANNATNSSLFYPDYSLPWDEGNCKSNLPIPSGRPTYSSIWACCAAAYAGQWSQACVNAAAAASGNNPSSTQPLYYPDYSKAWDDGKCINLAPIPSGRPTYSTMLACCKAAYDNQQSKTCIQALPSPPTSSPTKVGGPDIYYPDYSLPWPEGKCINTVPVPSGRTTYTTKLACCAGAYAGQSSRACVIAANA